LSLRRLARSIKAYAGVRRKSWIGGVVKTLAAVGPGIELDDAGAIERDGKVLLYSCDSIVEELVEADPYFAGYASVLVNVNDIAAMGGAPLAMVNVIWAEEEEIALEIARGMQVCAEKFGVKVAGGHVNPGRRRGIAVSMLGEAEAGSLITGLNAKAGEAIIAAVDLGGRLHPRYRYAWDSTSEKSGAELRRLIALPRLLGERRLVSSGKDVSNPGFIGSLGMLLEVSGVGGVVEVERVPRPGDVELELWLKLYPGYGFVFTAEERRAGEVLRLFKGHGIAAEVVGKVLARRKLLISSGTEEEVVFNFEEESIYGGR